MRRPLFFLALAALAPALGLVAWLASAGRAQPGKATPDEPTRKRVPLTQVVLFNTGVGFFQREGDIDGDARVDLSFPTTDINDLLKTLNVDDGGKPGLVSYDGPEQLEQSLHAFALDLSGNPTFGQLLNQARGSKVEVTLDGTTGTTPITGTIVGMESQTEAGNTESHHLNVLASDGVRRLPLNRVGRLRFLDSALDEEFRHALGVLAAGHNNARRNLNLHLAGDGKRKVKIGYVVETPIWKASYRLALDAKDAKPSLRGWAIVQNNSEEDWKGVRLVLVSGRPISFQMDLAQPLFVPRPTIEPEVYASLRPPIHPGSIVSLGQLGALGAAGAGGLSAAQVGGGGFTGQFGLGGSLAQGQPLNPMDEQGRQLGMPANPLLNRYQMNIGVTNAAPRLGWDELKQRTQAMVEARRKAQHVGSAVASVDETLESIALDADRIGEGFRYTAAEKLSLARQKSALVPMLNEPVQLARVSIYNRGVHPRFPLSGVKLKNTSDQHLQQGPIAVYDAGSYVGDSRLPDLAPGQERLVSFAMDLGVEVKPEEATSTTQLQRIEIVKGNLHQQFRQQTAQPYVMRNRSKQERTLLLEHPAIEHWTLVGKEKPTETTKSTHRFEWKLPAGEARKETIVQEREDETNQAVASLNEAQLREVIARPQASKAVKDALTGLLNARVRLAATESERVGAEVNLATKVREQERLRENLGKLPQTSAAYKRHVEKFDEIEREIEKLQKLAADKQEAEKKGRADLAATQATLTVS